MISRRRALLWSIAWWCAGCPEPVVPRERALPPPRLADVEVERLTDLLTAAHLRWLLLVKPEELSAIGWLKPSLSRVLQDERLDLLAAATGIQLREVSELALGCYDAADGQSSIAYLLRHKRDPLLLARKFRERLTTGAEHISAGHQLLAIWGLIGEKLHGLLSIGPFVAGYQYGGDKKRGPLHVALLYAQRKLDTVPTVLADADLALVDRRLAGAPIKAFLAGPFEGDMARGARGLFAAATAVGAALTPTRERTLALAVVLAGSFPAADAPRFLEGAFADLGNSDLGNLLGLSKLKAPVRVVATADTLELHTELDAALLLAGLSAATSDSIREIMFQSL